MSSFRIATSALRSTLRSAPSAARMTSARVSAAPSVSAIPRPSLSLRAPVLARFYAAGGGPSKDDITNRILDVLKSFEKVDPNKLSSSSAFTADLGLDSLDAVEVVMAIEEEFSIEIPDAEADNITTVQQAIDYISKTPEAI